MALTKDMLTKAHNTSFKDESRGPYYNWARKLIAAGYAKEAYILILATWNFAGFRYIVTNFDPNNFQDDLVQIEKNYFEKLEVYNLKRISLDGANITLIKETFIAIANCGKPNRIGPVGASKIIHLRLPDLFVMWDNAIRRGYKKDDYKEEYVRIRDKLGPSLHNFKRWEEREAKEYILFLGTMQEASKNIAWNKEQFDNTTLAKAIDEYNYSVYHP